MKIFWNGSLEQHNKRIIADYQKKQEQELLEMQKKATHKIIKAFVWDGIQYYQFADVNDMHTGRALQGVDYYNELGMKCTRDYLLAHTTAFDNEVKGTEINITKLAQLNQQLKERLEMIIPPDIWLKIASVVYWDKTENPYSYDDEYGRKKIEKWKKSDIDAFFLLKPIKDLIPSLNIPIDDLATFTKMETLMNEEHLSVISTMLSRKDAMKDWYASLGLGSIQAKEAKA